MIFCTKTYICLKNFQAHFTRRALTRTPGWYIRASFHILILIISLVVLLAYLFKIRYAYFTGGHICQPYRVEKVEQDRFAAEDRFHRARNLRPPTEWYSTFIPKKPESFPTRKWILDCQRCLAMNFVYWQTPSAYFYSRIYYYFFALKKLSQIYAKKS